MTPEATIAVCQRMTPGIPEAMRYESLKITNRAMLTRQQAGIRGRTLIVNLPEVPRRSARISPCACRLWITGSKCSAQAGRLCDIIKLMKKALPFFYGSAFFVGMVFKHQTIIRL